MTRSTLATALCVSVVLALPGGSAAAAVGDTTLVSVSSAGEQGNAFSQDAAISADGRFVAFSSFANNLVVGDTNGSTDVFVHDRQTGTTERVSLSSTGEQGNDGTSTSIPAISADGRYVAFVSFASNMVAGDTNGVADVFVRDRLIGATERVSVSSAGVEADARADNPAISADGRLVAFISNATNLVPRDTNGVTDVFAHDRLTGETERVTARGGRQADAASSTTPSLSADGRFVAFASAATNLVPRDTNAAADVFVRDRTTGTIDRVSVSSEGDQGDQASEDSSQGADGAISADGRFVAFSSLASNLVVGDTNGSTDVFLHDRDTGATERVSVSGAGAEANSASGMASISADGRRVAFASFASNLVAGDTNGAFDVFVRDRPAGTTQRVSVSSAGAEGDRTSALPAIAGNGSVVAFHSFATNLVANDVNESADVFVHELGP